MDLQTGGRRRRGQDLERAILEAAWDQLVQRGYGNFTIDAVAEAAGTSRSVLYRRWPDREDLITATLHFGLQRDRPAIPDTGNLRRDMLELLRLANTSRSQLVPLVSVLMGSYFSETGVSFAELRRQMIGEGGLTGLDEILERAVARGEIDSAKLSPRVRTVAFDLFRHDLLMTLQPLTEDEIEAIVDEVFLPLVGLAPSI